MIVARFSHPVLLGALRRAAHPDEDVVGLELADEAVARAFPRLVVRLGDRRTGGWPAGPATPGPVPTLVLPPGTLEAWDAGRRGNDVLRPRMDVMASRMSVLVRDHAARRSWVDRALSDVERASGATLPRSFRGVARRVMEFPSRYSDLGPLAELAGVGRDALRARFRRRDMASPFVWLRWFRLLPAAHLLSDRSVSIRSVGHRLGFDNDGNFCRFVRDVAGTSPTEMRSAVGRGRLIVRIALELDAPGCRSGWESLHGLFLESAA